MDEKAIPLNAFPFPAPHSPQQRRATTRHHSTTSSDGGAFEDRTIGVTKPGLTASLWKKKKKFLFCKLDNIYFEEQSTLIVSKRKKGVAFTVKTSERKTQLHLQACFTAAPALLWLLLGTAQKPKVQKQADTLCMRRCNAVSTLSTRYFAWGFFFFFFSCFGVLVWFFFFKGQN